MLKDYLGGFLVTAGSSIEEMSKFYEKKKDDYNSILIKSIGDRLAEGLAEKLHHDVRKKHWGYSRNEMLDNDDLIKERYIGIRPAHGYPACPDHTEKRTLFELLEISKNLDTSLTESYAISPSSSVAGLYFSNPMSAYFGIGKLKKDQIESYSSRKGISVEEAEKWLAPNLDYMPKWAA